jgi:hypothetical protein
MDKITLKDSGKIAGILTGFFMFGFFLAATVCDSAKHEVFSGTFGFQWFENFRGNTLQFNFIYPLIVGVVSFPILFITFVWALNKEERD